MVGAVATCDRDSRHPPPDAERHSCTDVDAERHSCTEFDRGRRNEGPVLTLPVELAG